jgi:hypothetical protein
MISEPLPENFDEMFELCFGEPMIYGRPGPATRMIRTSTSWLVYEPSGDTAFIHFAATFPGERKAGCANEGFAQAVATLKSEGFSGCHMVTKRENIAPQILALKNGFLMSGVIPGRDGKLEIIWRLIW